MDQHDFHFVTMLGSLRRGSFNRMIAATLDELAPDDVAVRLLASVGGLPRYNQDMEDVGHPPEVVAMVEAIAKADGVIIVTPEYNHSVPGVLKNALDWISRHPSRPFEHKPVALQSSSPGLLGGARCLDHLRQILVSMDAFVLNKPEITVTQVDGKLDQDAGTLRDEQTRRFIARQLHGLSELARRPVSKAA